MSVCVIPARVGSRRILLKNIRSFFGRPIIAYSIDAAKESGIFDKIVVSTDSADIADIVVDLGADVLIRAPELSVDSVGTYDVTLNAANVMKLEDEDVICCLYATAPMVSANDIALARSAIESFDVAHAITIAYPPLEDAAQFYMSVVGAMRSGIPYFDIYTGLIHVPRERVCDINTEDDWKRAEKMYMEFNKTRMH